MTVEALEPVTGETDVVKIKIDLALTREQIREVLGWANVEKSSLTDKMPVSEIRALISGLVSEAVQVSVVSGKSGLELWEFLSTDDEIARVESAVRKILPKQS